MRQSRYIVTSLHRYIGVAPSKSRNSSRVSQRRRGTTSSSIIAICAAGPPNAVVPSRRKSRPIIHIEVERSRVDKVSQPLNDKQTAHGKRQLREQRRRDEYVEYFGFLKRNCLLGRLCRRAPPHVLRPTNSSSPLLCSEVKLFCVELLVEKKLTQRHNPVL